MTSNTYACEICHTVNHAVRLQCKTCGTIPARYSLLNRPSILSDDLLPHFIEVVVAFGCDRVEHHHTSRSYMRTVPMDYYADC